MSVNILVKPVLYSNDIAIQLVLEISYMEDLFFFFFFFFFATIIDHNF